MMRQMSCVFCKQEVGAPIDVIEVKDEVVLAVCDNCYVKGGRLPGAQWEVSVDGEGRPRTQEKQRFFSKNNHFAYEIIGCAIGYTIAALVFSNLSFGFLLILAAAIALLVKSNQESCKPSNRWWSKLRK